MINLIWFLLLAIGIVVGVANGRTQEVTEAAIDSAETAVELAIGLIGIMALWLGIMKIAEEGGLVRLLAKAVKPVMVRLFPDVPAEHPAMGSMLMNIAANILGLGNAATPLGLKAMIELQKINPHKETASNAMCTFLALNTSSLTLIPATIIGLRAAADSQNPTEVIGPIIVPTTASTIAAIIAVKLLEKLPVFSYTKAMRQPKQDDADQSL